MRSSGAFSNYQTIFEHAEGHAPNIQLGTRGFVVLLSPLWCTLGVLPSSLRLTGARSTMPRMTRVLLTSPSHLLPLVLAFSRQLAPQTQAFVVSPPRAPHDVAVRRRPAPGGHRRAAVEDATDTVALTAEEWHGFSEEDHDRFLAEFWQKKPLLIRQAVKG